MEEKISNQIDGQSTPKYNRDSKQRIKMIFNRNKQIYLTDNQLSSSDQTKSSSEMNLLRIQYEGRIKKLQKQNKELKQTIIQLKASQFYQLDQERIKAVIRENQGLKSKMIDFEQEIKILDQELTKIQIQNQYLKRNNKELKENYQIVVKDIIKQRHSSKKITCVYDDQNYSMQSSQIQREKDDKYYILNNINSDRNNQQRSNQNNLQIDEQYKPKKITQRNKSRYRSNSKSQQRNLLSQVGSKNMLKKSKKHADIPSTAQSQSIKRYSSSNNLLTFKIQTKIKQNKSLTSSRTPNNGQNGGTTTRKKNQQVVKEDYNGEYFESKKQREPYISGYISKKKKCVYYN